MLIKCPECGREVSDKAPACPGCGHLLFQNLPSYHKPATGTSVPASKSSNWFLPAFVGTVLLLCIVAAIVSSRSSAPASDQSSAPASDQSAPVPEPTLPAAQAQFDTQLRNTYDHYLASYDNAPNDVAKRQVQDEFEQAYSSLCPQQKTFTNWMGTITELWQPGLTPMFKFDMGRGVIFDNGEDADTGADALDTNSPAYKKVLQTLHVGDQISVSGKFEGEFESEGDSCTAAATLDLGDHKFQPVLHVILSELNGADAQVPGPFGTVRFRSDATSSAVTATAVTDTSTGGAPTSPVAVRQAQPSQAFAQGQADRQRFEAWFAGLSGDYLAGASYWTGNRSRRPPPVCSGLGVPFQVTPTWSQGCEAARQELAPADRMRLSSPDFRRGWNSTSDEAQPRAPPAPGASQ
jgi:hypothetical protein